MKNFKKILAFLCSATLIVSSSLTAFAAEDTTAGAGTIVAYRVDTVTVPTSVKLLFNPQGWKVTRWDGDTVGSTDQVVSLNYGITTESNFNKAVKVSFTATGGASTVTNPAQIELVSTAAAATTSAGDDEYKIYLAVAPSTAAPQARGAGDGGADVAFGLDEDGASTATAEALADVAMTAKTDAAVVFSGTAASSTADIAYLLTKAEYEIASGQSIDFETTAADYDNIFALKTIGGVVGFTFTGAMNNKVDWTKANLSSISIQPEYEYVDAPASLEASEDAGYQQIDIEDFPETESTFVVTYNGNGGTTEAESETENVAENGHPSNAPTYTREGYTQTGWATTAEGEAAALSSFTITEATTLYAIWEEDEPETPSATITKGEAVTVTLAANSSGKTVSTVAFEKSNGTAGAVGAARYTYTAGATSSTITLDSTWSTNNYDAFNSGTTFTITYSDSSTEEFILNK